MSLGTRIAFEPIREIAAASISGSYTQIGGPLSDHARIITFSNDTAQEIYISMDGQTDHIRMAQSSFKLLDLSVNKVRNDGLFLSKGTQIFVRFVSTTTAVGNVWIEIVYGKGGK